MKNFFLNIIRQTLRIFNYEIKKIQKKILFPPEFDEKDKSIFHYIRKNKLSMVSDDRLFATIMSCKYVIKNNIDGDFVECGTAAGGNAIAAKLIFKKYDSNKKVIMFDTFAGMTKPSDYDVRNPDHLHVTHENKNSIRQQYLDNQKEGYNSWTYYPIDEVKNNFENAGIQIDESIKFVKGDVGQTLKKSENIPSSIAILRLDTDFYESTLIELEYLYPKLKKNGILLIDDYGHFLGAKKAVDEYFEKINQQPYMNITDYTGRSIIKTI